MGRFYKVVKHALGSFNSEDGYEKELEDKMKQDDTNTIV